MASSDTHNVSKNQLLQRRYRLLGKNASLFYNQPVHVVRGEGVWLYDADGKRYLDVYNNVPSVGHCHPHIVKALAQQAATLNVHTRYLHELIVEYGERLTAKFDDSLSMLFLTCSGTEANEVALRMARHCTGGRGIICTNDAYHGNSTAVDALATQFNKGKPNGPDVLAVDFPDSYRAPPGLAGRALARFYADQVENAIANFRAQGIGFAGMLVCPIFANEGLPDVPAGYLNQIAQHVRDAGGVLIFDEVQSAFGRTGKMWGHELSGVIPDIVTLGKPMGNGHPLAAAVCRPDLGNEFRASINYFNTFGGNPVSCAVGLAVLEVIEQEQLVANAAQVGAYLQQGLSQLAEKYDLIGDVRGQGLFVTAELVTDRETRKPASIEAGQITNSMKQHGVLINKIGRHDNILKMRPPICFSQDNADLLLATLDRVFSQLSF